MNPTTTTYNNITLSNEFRNNTRVRYLRELAQGFQGNNNIETNFLNGILGLNAALQGDALIHAVFGIISGAQPQDTAEMAAYANEVMNISFLAQEDSFSMVDVDIEDLGQAPCTQGNGCNTTCPGNTACNG